MTTLAVVAPGAASQDAAEAEMLQNHLAAGYELRNPPLYDWLLWGVQQLGASGLNSYLIVRYGLISCTGILFYFAVLRLVANRRLAAAFSLSLVLFYWFGWEAHNEVSHSLTILVTLLLFWLATIAYLDKRTAIRAFAVGLTLGLGILGKWSFVFVALGIGLALAFDPKARRVFNDPRSLLILAGAVLIFLPTSLWLIGINPNLIRSNLNVIEPGSGFSKTLRILGQFITILSIVFLPWLLVVVVLAFRFRREVQPIGGFEAARIRITLIAAAFSGGSLVVILAGCALFGWNLFGIAEFAPHYLHPSCVLASLGITGLVAARVQSDAFSRALGAVSLATAFGIFLAKLASFYIVLPHSAAGHLLPYTRLADKLAAAGLGEAQFVAVSARDAGNLIIYMPNARALSPSRRIEPPPADRADRPCVLLWGGEYYIPPQRPPIRQLPRALNRFGVTPDNGFIEDMHIDWGPPLIGASRRSVWHILWKDPVAEEACRRFVREGGVLGLRSPRI